MKVTWKKESKKRPLAAISKYPNLPFDQQDMLHNDDEDNNSHTDQLGASHKSMDSEASNRQLADSFQDLGNKLAEVFPSLPHSSSSSSSFFPWKVQILQYYCGTYAIIEFFCDISVFILQKIWNLWFSGHIAYATYVGCVELFDITVYLFWMAVRSLYDLLVHGKERLLSYLMLIYRFFPIPAVVFSAVMPIMPSYWIISFLFLLMACLWCVCGVCSWQGTFTELLDANLPVFSDSCCCIFCSYANNAKLLNYLVSISVDGMSLMCVWCLFSSICFGIRQIEEETLFGSTGSSLFYALLK